VSILNDLISGDSHRIWEGACAVRVLRDIDQLRELSRHIAEIDEKTRSVSLGGAFRPNSAHVKFALKKLQFVKESAGCLCRLYAHDEFYNPVQEANDGVVRILSKVEKDGYPDYYLCECCSCGRRYRVSEREYHYTWWQWEDAESGSGDS